MAKEPKQKKELVQKINIRISSEAGIGRTTLARAIATVLNKAGLNVEILDDKEDTEIPPLDDVLDSVSKHPIVIETMQYDGYNFAKSAKKVFGQLTSYPEDEMSVPLPATTSVWGVAAPQESAVTTPTANNEFAHVAVESVSNAMGGSELSQTEEAALLQSIFGEAESNDTESETDEA